MYRVGFTIKAREDVAKLGRSERQAHKKFTLLIQELCEHPETGTGHPEPLGGSRAGQWSRRITQKHRLVYLINKEEMEVLVISAYGHYDDK
ncbi:MAG: Txe/YoeB family addiction module toxin [Prevotellaceae bacterium]|jgi:toxin YoeB|nr:Txe/YoeB family addiction module toxin [Prevotellaceae bacterium]